MCIYRVLVYVCYKCESMAEAVCVISYSGNKAALEHSKYITTLSLLLNKMSSHLPICPSMFSLLNSISVYPSLLHCFPSPLGDVHLAFPLSINAEI